MGIVAAVGAGGMAVAAGGRVTVTIPGGIIVMMRMRGAKGGMILKRVDAIEIEIGAQEGGETKTGIETKTKTGIETGGAVKVEETEVAGISKDGRHMPIIEIVQMTY